MIAKRSLLPFAPFALAAVLCGCTQKNTGDQPAAPNVPTGLERFLLFPNPIAQSSGGFETDTNAYADAYSSAIDPTNAKDTLVFRSSIIAFRGSAATPRLACRA